MQDTMYNSKVGMVKQTGIVKNERLTKNKKYLIWSWCPDTWLVTLVPVVFQISNTLKNEEHTPCPEFQPKTSLLRNFKLGHRTGRVKKFVLCGGGLWWWRSREGRLGSAGCLAARWCRHRILWPELGKVGPKGSGQLAPLEPLRELGSRADVLGRSGQAWATWSTSGGQTWQDGPEINIH